MIIFGLFCCLCFATMANCIPVGRIGCDENCRDHDDMGLLVLGFSVGASGPPVVGRLVRWGTDRSRTTGAGR